MSTLTNTNSTIASQVIRWLPIRNTIWLKVKNESLLTSEVREKCANQIFDVVRESQHWLFTEIFKQIRELN